MNRNSDNSFVRRGRMICLFPLLLFLLIVGTAGAFVETLYPGNSPVDIENLITRPIEKELKGMQGVKQVTSASYQDASIIIVEFNTDVPVKVALQDTKDRVDKARTELPEDLEKDFEHIYEKQLTAALRGKMPLVYFFGTVLLLITSLVFLAWFHPKLSFFLSPIPRRFMWKRSCLWGQLSTGWTK